MVVQDSVKLITNGWIDADARISRQDDQNRARFSSSLLPLFFIFVYLFLPALPFFFFPVRQTRPRKYEIPRACRITIHRGDGYHHTAGRVRDDLADAMASRSRGLRRGYRTSPLCFNNERRRFRPTSFRFHLVSPSIKICNLTQSYRARTRCDRHLLFFFPLGIINVAARKSGAIHGETDCFRITTTAFFREIRYRHYRDGSRR